VEQNVSPTSMSEYVITHTLFQTALKRVPNWKAPGLDCIHGYWLKHFTSVHKHLLQFYNDLIGNEGHSLNHFPELLTGHTTYFDHEMPS